MFSNVPLGIWPDSGDNIEDWVTLPTIKYLFGIMLFYKLPQNILYSMWFYYLFIYEEQCIGLIGKQYAPAFCSLFILPGSISREELSISRLRRRAAASQKSSNTQWTASVMLYGTDSTNLILLFTITLPLRKFSISNCLNPVRLDCRYGTSWKNERKLFY